MGNEIAWWIDRVDKAVQEAAQMDPAPLLSKAAIMAQLYQAQALNRIANAAEAFLGIVSRGKP